jgi:hypothetical protein
MTRETLLENGLVVSTWEEAERILPQIVEEYDLGYHAKGHLDKDYITVTFFEGDEE